VVVLNGIFLTVCCTHPKMCLFMCRNSSCDTCVCGADTGVLEMSVACRDSQVDYFSLTCQTLCLAICENNSTFDMVSDIELSLELKLKNRCSIPKKQFLILIANHSLRTKMYERDQQQRQKAVILHSAYSFIQMLVQQGRGPWRASVCGGISEDQILMVSPARHR
jgi:hypothetical protein